MPTVVAFNQYSGPVAASSYDGWLPPLKASLTPYVEPCWYTDPNGRETDLSTIFGQQYKAGIDGRYISALAHLSEPVPEQDGERYRFTRMTPRALVIPITFVADDMGALRARIREVTRGLNPKLGMGTLTVQTFEGFTRSIHCLYESGAESGVDGTADGSGVWQTVSYTFRAFDPFWYGTSVSDTFTIGNSPQTFFPAPPFRIGSSNVFAQEVIDNDGDAEAFPIWTVTGPGDSLTFDHVINGTTVDSLSLAISLNETQSVTIDTRPGIKSVQLNDGTNLFPKLTGSLWSLDPGYNNVTISMLNATGASRVTYAFSPRYHGA